MKESNQALQLTTSRRTVQIHMTKTRSIARFRSPRLSFVSLGIARFVCQKPNCNLTMTTEIPTIPPDDLKRNLALARPNEDQALSHIGLAGDTYTVLLTGKDTAGRYCLIDMLVTPGGGPPPHRHDFEEMFSILEGEIEFNFRGAKLVVRSGETVNIPANAPHHFRNVSERSARLLCMCSPAGQEEYFMAVGVPVTSAPSPPPKT